MIKALAAAEGNEVPGEEQGRNRAAMEKKKRIVGRAGGREHGGK